MAQNAGLADTEYEINEKGERVLVRSLEATRRAYLRFTNKTSRPIDVWWRDYSGSRRFYVKLEPKSHYDINTYLTHPWEFTDSATKERYVINNNIVFRPPKNIGGMHYRTNWNITVSVRTLRMSALLTLGLRIRDPEAVGTLGLPVSLARELRNMVVELHRPVIAVPTD